MTDAQVFAEIMYLIWEHGLLALHDANEIATHCGAIQSNFPEDELWTFKDGSTLFIYMDGSGLYFPEDTQ